MSVSSSNSAFKRFCDKHNVGKGFDETQYVLRHSCATRKIEAGVPPEVLKDTLGHKSIDVTLDTYFDAFAEYKNKYNQQSELYNKQQNITYLNLTKEEILSTELSKIEHSLISLSFDDIDIKMLQDTINKIKSKYNLLKEKTSW